ncbi:MAG: extensin family protein [Pseudomonadota bacterium]
MRNGQARLLLGAALLLSSGTLAEPQDAVPLPREKPATAQPQPEDDAVAATPVTGPPTTGGRASGATFYEMTGPVTVTWPEAASQRARAACGSLLDGLAISFKAVDPIGGPESCGAAAPVEVSSVHGVTISPPATLTCPFANRLHHWAKGALQQAAAAALDDEVTALVNVASYTCRLTRSDISRGLSQHAFSNALDISKFKLRRGDPVSVTDDWGNSEDPDNLDERARFLRYVHESACEVFSTVLGPDANAHHKDHFHFDNRKKGSGFVTCK